MPLWHIFWLASTSIPDNCQCSKNFRHKSEVPQVYPVPSVIQISSDVFGEAIHWGHAVLARCGWHVTIDSHSWSFLQYVWFKGHAQKMLEAFWLKDSHQNLTWPSEKKHERHALLQQRSCTFAIGISKIVSIHKHLGLESVKLHEANHRRSSLQPLLILFRISVPRAPKVFTLSSSNIWFKISCLCTRI